MTPTPSPSADVQVLLDQLTKLRKRKEQSYQLVLSFIESFLPIVGNPKNAGRGQIELSWPVCQEIAAALRRIQKEILNDFDYAKRDGFQAYLPPER